MKKLMTLMLVLCLPAVGCATDDAAEDEQEEDEKAAEVETIKVSGKEYAFDLPETVPGGFVNIEFKNEGGLVHEAHFVKVDQDVPQEQFIKDFKTASGVQGARSPPT